ncbi:MAG: hypothetical protein AAF202_01660, partial [Pseudomonadota bacterium]
VGENGYECGKAQGKIKTVATVLPEAIRPEKATRPRCSHLGDIADIRHFSPSGIGECTDFYRACSRNLC